VQTMFNVVRLKIVIELINKTMWLITCPMLVMSEEVLLHINQTCSTFADNIKL